MSGQENKMSGQGAGRKSIASETHTRMMFMAERIESLSGNLLDKLRPICSIEHSDLGEQVATPRETYPPLFNSFRDELDRIEISLSDLEDVLLRVEL